MKNNEDLNKLYRDALIIRLINQGYAQFEAEIVAEKILSKM